MEETFTVTREKHLDHLVKVVPLIVLAYAVQCYFLSGMESPLGPGAALTFLGVSLGAMIGCFITYDVKHKVVLFQDHLKISFLGRSKSIAYKDITHFRVADPDESFSGITIHCLHGRKFSLYFVDDADKIVKWIESRKLPLQSAA